MAWRLSIMILFGLFSMWTQPSDSVCWSLRDILNEIEKASVTVDTKLCAVLKRLFKVEYSQYGKEDVDLTKLKLHYVTPAMKVQYNLLMLQELPKQPWFNPDKGLIIYMHGFIEDPTWGSSVDIDKAFFSQGIHNLLALDASSLIRFAYLRSTTMVHMIGHALGTAIVHMMQAGLNPKLIHLIGHSLGSHIAGFTGKTVYAQSGWKVGRISGLDPAGPCFTDVSSEDRLHSSDADFVDVMHTDAGVYGLDMQIGDEDFYPNSGTLQPRCITHVCSHSRAWEFFAESIINPKGFPAVRCHSWDAFKRGDCDYNDVKYMGFGNRPKGLPGRYYLVTAGRFPYALGYIGLNYTQAKSKYGDQYQLYYDNDYN